MFSLLRSPRVMRAVVIVVAATFLIGFAGIFAFAGMELPLGSPEPAGNELAEQVDEYVRSLQAEIETYEGYGPDELQARDMRYLGDLYFQLAQTLNYYYGENVDEELHQALDAYSRALHLDPDETTALLAKAITQSALGQLDEAQSSYEAFLDIHPDHFDGQASYTHLLILKERTDEAVQQMERLRTLADGEQDEAVIEELEQMLAQ